jgi:hypothetical protein
MAESKFLNDFLSPYEAEHLISNLKDIDIQDYGSKQYSLSHF